MVVVVGWHMKTRDVWNKRIIKTMKTSFFFRWDIRWSYYTVHSIELGGEEGRWTNFCIEIHFQNQDQHTLYFVQWLTTVDNRIDDHERDFFECFLKLFSCHLYTKLWMWMWITFSTFNLTLLSFSSFYYLILVQKKKI